MKFSIFIALSLSLISGCAVAARYNPYLYQNGMTQNDVVLGRVIAVQPVTGGTGAENVGGLLGAVGGLALGNRVGHGVGKLIATVAGGVLGGIFGSRIEQHLERTPVVQVTVRLDDGRIIAVVEKQFEFEVGQRVQVIYSPSRGWGHRGTVRVLPL